MRTFFEIGAEGRLINNQLLRLKELINWRKIDALLKKVHSRDESPNHGGFTYNKLSMFKAILLGQWHNLSDTKLEEALRVRLDFMVFTGFHLGQDIPDETTFCRFRNKLMANKLLAMLLERINQELTEQGLMVEGAACAVVDATVIKAAARPRRTIHMSIDREEEEIEDSKDIKTASTGAAAGAVEVVESADKDAAWLKKGMKSYYGYKGYIATDSTHGYIQKVSATPANSSEVAYFTTFAKDIKAERIIGDKGYASAKNRAFLKERGIKDGIMHKAYKNSALRESQKKFNKLISKQRFVVEQAFGTLKRKFNMAKASYFGLHKVEGQLLIKAMCFNLLKALNLVASTRGCFAHN